MKLITTKQIDLMEQLGIPWNETMTRQEASDLITEAIETSEHPFSEDALGQ